MTLKVKFLKYFMLWTITTLLPFCRVTSSDHVDVLLHVNVFHVKKQCKDGCFTFILPLSKTSQCDRLLIDINQILQQHSSVPLPTCQWKGRSWNGQEEESGRGYRDWENFHWGPSVKNCSSVLLFWIILNYFELFWIILNYFELFWIILSHFEI